MKIFVLDTPEGRICVNSGNDENDAILVQQGARQLTDAEITVAGMKGYEQYVSPVSTVVHEDGSITFTPPNPEEQKEEFFVRLRSARNARISATDYLLVADYPIDADKLEQVKAYRQALRDLPKQKGAPWDGGGKKTPWPVKTWEVTSNA